MHPNAAVIQRFYDSFQKKDAAGMAACYHPAIEFSDPAFPALKGPQAGAMWKMLCERGGDLKIEFSGIEADDHKGKAHWEAWYTFSQTGRKVHNVIDAEMEFRDGKIVKHTDRFNFWRWAGMALGPVGKLLGWTPFLKNKVQAQCTKLLASFMKKNG